MKQTILVTGAGGEVGHGLINSLGKKENVISVDIKPLAKELIPLTSKSYTGDILDNKLLKRIFAKHNFDIIFHLAAVLSTSAEKDPLLAHNVNVNGTINLLEQTRLQTQKRKKPVKFIFPSSIAVYGLPDLKAKKKSKKVKEAQFLNPITMYGVNKLYCENIGIYFSTHHKLLAASFKGIDFRCLRFPGLISADTIPTGGTSDYAPEMLHNAAQKKAYKCFVRPDTTIPFMAMPDAVKSLLQLSKVAKARLKSHVYNVSGFNASVKEISQVVRNAFPKVKITYRVDKNRQKIVDSWPEDVNDSKARKDWGWKPDYNFKDTFQRYLIPQITQRYQ